jgi:hypothetical protein
MPVFAEEHLEMVADRVPGGWSVEDYLRLEQGSMVRPSRIWRE